MAPTETLETEMARDSHNRTPVPCDFESCPEVDRVNELWLAVMGKGSDTGIKGTVDRHERLIVTTGKFLLAVMGTVTAAGVILLISMVSFVSTANKLRAEMHQDSTQQTQLK